MTTVPCNGCRACCQGDAIRLLEGDDPAQFQVVPHPKVRGGFMLEHKPNGDCVYLGETGCTIHERKPKMCRQFDCRNLAVLSWTIARKAGIVRVWRRGRELEKKYGKPS